MAITIPQIVRQFKANVAKALSPETITAFCAAKDAVDFKLRCTNRPLE